MVLMNGLHFVPSSVSYICVMLPRSSHYRNSFTTYNDKMLIVHKVHNVHGSRYQDNYMRTIVTIQVPVKDNYVTDFGQHCLQLPRRMSLLDYHQTQFWKKIFKRSMNIGAFSYFGGPSDVIQSGRRGPVKYRGTSYDNDQVHYSSSNKWAGYIMHFQHVYPRAFLLYLW